LGKYTCFRRGCQGSRQRPAGPAFARQGTPSYTGSARPTEAALEAVMIEMTLGVLLLVTAIYFISRK